MKIRSVVLLVVFVAFLADNVSGQQECNALLAQGIRESVKTATYSQEFSQVKNSVCEAYNEYKRSGDAAKASGSYSAIFKGSGSYSKERIESLGKTYCEASDEIQAGRDYKTIDRTYIDPNFSQMYQTCISAFDKQNLRLDLRPIDALNRSITLHASYLSTTSGLRPRVTRIDYNSEFIEVTGSLKDAAESKSELNGFLTLTAVRKDIKNTPFPHGNEMFLALGRQLTITFENGAITINFPEIKPISPSVVLTTGIGEIVASMLSVEQFKNAYNRNGERWELAQGQDAPPNSRYTQLVKLALPDLRGVFLRGRNYGREPATGNPEGDYEVGEYRKDDVISHAHGLTQLDIGGGETNDQSDNVRAKWRNRVQEKTDAFGGTETRPRNVSVNYFIRVD